MCRCRRLCGMINSATNVRCPHKQNVSIQQQQLFLFRSVCTALTAEGSSRGLISSRKMSPQCIAPIAIRSHTRNSERRYRSKRLEATELFETLPLGEGFTRLRWTLFASVLYTFLSWQIRVELDWSLIPIVQIWNIVDHDGKSTILFCSEIVLANCASFIPLGSNMAIFSASLD